jgi:hypothetical protein
MAFSRVTHTAASSVYLNANGVWIASDTLTHGTLQYEVNLNGKREAMSAVARRCDLVMAPGA